MTKTFKELSEIDQFIYKLYLEDKSLERSKFGYAYKKFSDKNFLPTLKELKERIEDIKASNCLEDKVTHEILRDEKGNFKYSKDGWTKLTKELKEEYEKTDPIEIECVPFISSFKPEGLTEDEIDLLTGLVI